jgi:hypothetical protein
MAVGDELGSNTLRVGQSSPEGTRGLNSSGGDRKPAYSRPRRPTGPAVGGTCIARARHRGQTGRLPSLLIDLIGGWGLGEARHQNR